jgi:hypothetical protein
MATTTNLTQVNGTRYTWGNQALLWSDSLAGLRTWDVSYATIAYTMAAGETLNFLEVLSNRPGLNKSESFAFVEARTSSIGLNPSEAVAFSELGAKAVGQSHSETLGFAELPSNRPGVNKSESFAVSEARTSGIGLNPSEAVAFAELNAKAFGQHHSETVAIGEAPSLSFGKSLSESFAFAEALGKSVSLSKSEAIGFAELGLNSVGFIRNFAETFAVAEAIGKNFGLKKAEAFAMVDAWRRQGDLVISDMMISGAGDFTMTDFEDFLTYGNVPGYEKWRDFIPGDYEYREAMFRVVLQSKNADRGLLTDLQATVDVPDLIDRGSATITVAASGIAVTYNRVFHVVPEITLAARGGQGANPIAPEFSGSPTKTGFTVKMRDTVTGAFVTGSFTWAAHGY